MVQVTVDSSLSIHAFILRFLRTASILSQMGFNQKLELFDRLSTIVKEDFL